MIQSTLPDLTRFNTLQNQRADIERRLDNARSELVTGSRATDQRVDPVTAGQLERTTANRLRLEAEQIDLNTQNARLAITEVALNDLAGILGEVAIMARNAPQGLVAPDVASASATDALDRLVGRLRQTDGERPVFPGGQNAPLPLTTEQLLTTAKAQIAAGSDLQSALSAMFSESGDFITQFAPTPIPDNVTPDLPDEQQASLASAATRDALLTNVSLVLSFDTDLSLLQRQDAASLASSSVSATQNSVLELRSNVGRQQANAERRSVEAGAELTALRLTEQDLIGADPAEAASRVQALEGQLETLYLIIGRSSQLSLARSL